MWLCTTRGFFSAVEHRDDPSLLLVRARVRQDLVNLRELLPRLFWTRIVASPRADYPFRMTVRRADFAAVVSRLITDELRYPNFKAAVPSPSHEAAYHEVWAVLRQLEQPRSMTDDV